MLVWIWESLAAIAFGVVSAVVPVFNAEAYVVGAGLSGRFNPVTAGIGVAIGQTVGKLVMFLAVRYRTAYTGGRRRRAEPKALDLSSRWGRLRQRHRDLSKRLLDALGDPRYGIPITLLSSLVGIPPLYAVALVAGASRMRVLAFGGAVLAGRMTRFVTLALGVSIL